MKVSIIVAVYNDIDALELIFTSCEYQTYREFEVVVAEDGESKAMKEFIGLTKSKYKFDIIHTTQQDSGVQKSKSQNNGIKASTGEYLIFIDGDCLLYSNFIENHVALSSPANIVAGRRVNLGKRYSKKLRDRELNSLELERNFIKKYFDIKNDAKKERHSEEGFTIKANGLIYKIINKVRNKKITLLGCNMSFYKKAIEEINGFDEGLGNSAMAGDTDLDWRFQGLGYKIVSARYCSNEFHLYHKRGSTGYSRGADEKMLNNQNEELFRCIDGLIKLKD